MNTTLLIVNFIAFGLILVWASYEVIQYFRRKNAGEDLTAEEFKKEMRRAQIIDLREKDEFDAGHILGARNIPFLQFRQRMPEIRKDQPVYLYDERETFSRRASLLMKKEGYTKIYRLKDGYDKWDGRIKSNR